jgi:hypothetical protein
LLSPPQITVENSNLCTKCNGKEHLRHLANRFEGRLPNPDPAQAPTVAAATGKPPQAESTVDVDLALTYLHRSCSLTSLAVKHLDVAVAFISSFLDPDEVANISKWTDQRTYYTSEVHTGILCLICYYQICSSMCPAKGKKKSSFPIHSLHFTAGRALSTR